MTSDEIKTVVRAFSERTLATARDARTGLMADGVRVATGEPARISWGGQERVACNYASQQQWTRMLVGLSALTGDDQYRTAAEETGRAVFARLQHPGGLLYWGGHMGWDLLDSVPFGHMEGRWTHELKTHHPYYEFLWQLEPTKTRRFIEAFWDAHVQNWDNLDLSRHGWYTDRDDTPSVWSHDYPGSEVFFVGEGLSFCNTGSDLIYAASMLHHFTGDAGPLTWALRLAGRYDETRDPDTGLVGYQYSQVSNDRARVQFGEEYGDRALEGKILDSGRTYTRYGKMGLSQLQVAETLGDAGSQFLEWAHADLTALATHCYDSSDGMMHAMWSDGHRLYPSDVKRPGYYSPQSFGAWQPQAGFLRTYAQAYRLTGDELMWRMVVDVAKSHGLGELGSTPGAARSLNVATDMADVDVLLGLLDLHRTAPAADLLALAGRIGDNILAATWHGGWFRPSAAHRYARIDSREALALLHLAAAQSDAGDVVPVERESRCDFQAEFDNAPHSDKWGRSHDNTVIYAQTDA